MLIATSGWARSATILGACGLVPRTMAAPSHVSDVGPEIYRPIVRSAANAAIVHRGPRTCGSLCYLDHDVAAGNGKAAYVEGFCCHLHRGWRLIASQLPHQGKDDVGVGAVVVLF